MIVLDTNVLSELMRMTPDPRVVAWLNRQPRASLFTTALTRAELLYGVRLLAEGERKANLMGAVLDTLAVDFADQVLSFDTAASDAYADIAASRKALGRPISQIDAMIAAIARSRGASVATRNVRDFVDCGVALIDPWIP